MSEVRRLPSLVYEVVPEHFDPGADGSPLQQVVGRLAHLESLGVDTICLTPIFPGAGDLRLHTTDYLKVDEQLGSVEDFSVLCAAAAERGIAVFVMAAFDHTSSEHDWFELANAHSDDEGAFPPEQRTRPFYTFDDAEEHGYACRDGDAEAPELDLRNPDVRRRLFTGEMSVLHRWLNAGAAGWRILRADAVGYSILRELRRGALTVDGGRTLIGDIKGFADRYVKDGILDGVVHHYQREAVIAWLRGQVPARQLSRVMRDVSASYGKSAAYGWNLLSSHDTERIGVLLGDRMKTRLATILSYTLPGATVVFYGDEVGLTTRPGQGSVTAMSWDTHRWDDDLHRLHTDLGALRTKLVALREGEFVDVTPEGEEEVLAFARITRDPRETVLVAINRAHQTRVRKLFAPVCDLPDGLKLRDALGGPGATVRSGTVTLDVPAQGARMLIPDEADAAGARFFRGY